MTDSEISAPSAPDPGAPRPRRPRRRRGRITAVIIAVVLLPFAVVGSGAVWFWWQLDGHGSQTESVPVTIDRGWGVPRIAKELQHEHIVTSSFVFQVYARFNGDNSFEAGTYDLHKNIGVRAAVKALKAGPKIDYVQLTIPPGFWIKQIAARVGGLPSLSARPFLQGTRNNAVRSLYEPPNMSNLEGLLRPDTYRVSNSEDEIGILQSMVTAFDSHAKKLGLTAVVDGHSAYDVIKVASLIESEAKVPQDRPLIASVIYNRLAANMPLQIDSTVIYARGNPADRGLSTKDLQIASPYNNYLHAGLPPTPIGAVSDASLRAALAPAHTDYLYYVLAGKDGHHAFSSTFAQQQQNIEAARRAGLL